MLNYFKEWLKDLNEAQKVMNDSGIFVAYHQFGSYVHYVDPDLCTHINTSHDKQETISRDN
ncbi:MAG: hypothetical protein CMQ88_02290 [Gammaproteobacteria bacterium]|nr:hypothetical protein [Gammaproteobacteria bacterium]|tara:strand:- start:5916 stop:6098 length:183 start_codon:yes stop_codon:yes gene_type:complete